jgi:outer membrane murein-binding lipoprotein Lpp
MRSNIGFCVAAAGLSLLVAGCSDPTSTATRERPVAQAAVEVRTLDAAFPDPAYDAHCETGAVLLFKAHGSYDPVGQALSYEWRDTVEGELVPDFTPRTNPLHTDQVEVSANVFTVGIHELTLTVTARDGRKASTSLRILVGPCGSCGG